MSNTNKLTVLVAVISLLFVSCNKYSEQEKASYQVLERTIGKEKASKFELKLVEKPGENDAFSIETKDGKVYITGNSQVALCRGAYDYLKNAGNSIISWSGNNIQLSDTLPVYSNKVESPYYYKYYMNVVTHGYTTPYWDWARWEKEIDWMALHGMNMPLIGGAHEAILERVFSNLGLNENEVAQYFSGPAHFPWNRMGNLTGWDGNLPKSFFKKQIELNHKVLARMKELGMHPIIPAFAGFVPNGIKRVYPNEKLRELDWGCGLDSTNKAHILEPGSKLFVEIGKMYIKEWENEFGKAELYLADSFNEMEVPLSSDSIVAAKELAGYGASVYSSIHEANPDAKWVMQGWTFPFFKGKDGKLFWTPYRLHALVSAVPDDKLIILDLANEYNRLWWKNEPSWKMYDGFFGKGWVYSFIPNMGGKVPLNGILDLYATMPAEALQYKNKKNLVGFGFAPEGIENNEIIYELLSDIAWTDKSIDLNAWIPKYCTQRYGAFPAKMKEAFTSLNKSCYGSFVPHPRHRYQLHPNIDFKSLIRDFQNDVHSSEDYRKGVELFLNASAEIKSNPLYTYDAIELTTQYLGLRVDLLLEKFRENPEQNKAQLDEALQLLGDIDRLLATHPNHSLKRWVEYARAYGDNVQESNYYEANAKRLITTWSRGFTVLDDYSARTWNGMVGDYYLQRWKLYYNTPKEIRDQALLDWQEKWIQTPYISKSKPFDNPLKAAIDLFTNYNNGTLKSIPNVQK